MMSALNDLVEYGEVPYGDLLNARAELAQLRAELAAARRTIEAQAAQAADDDKEMGRLRAVGMRDKAQLLTAQETVTAQAAQIEALTARDGVNREAADEMYMSFLGGCR